MYKKKTIFEPEEFNTKMKDYVSLEALTEVAEKSQKLKDEKIVNIEISKENKFRPYDENIPLNTQMYNLASLKNVLTSIFPNLQRPNITKA